MAHPDPKKAQTGRRMAHRPRRGPLRLLADLVRAIVPGSRRAQSVSAVSATATGSADSAGFAPRSVRTYRLAAEGLAGSLARLGRRFGPKEPHRRELTAVLALVLVACALSASLPAVWAAPAGPSSDPSGRVAGNLDPTDPSASASLPAGSSSPEPTLAQSTLPPPSESPTLPPAASLTPAPTKVVAPARAYTFVALGDSLTAWPANEPWPVRLDAEDARLRMVNNAGVPGDLTSEMLARLDSDVLAYKPDVLFVLGGTNDVGHYISAATTIRNLKAIIVAAKAKGIRVILLTIPPDSYPYMAAPIDSLNSAIVHLGNAYGLLVVDIHAALSTSAGVYVPKYTSDGLHFSALGAQKVADTVYVRARRVGL